MFKFRKGRLVLALMGMMTITGYAADPFSFQSTPANAPPVNTKRPPPLSSSDFRSKVTEANKEARREVLQQSQSSLKQQESQLPLPTPPASQESRSFNPPPAKRAKPTPPPASESTEAVTPVAPASLPKQDNTPPAEQSQVYTGFGAGSPNTGTSTGTGTGATTTPPPASTGGGWKVY